MESRVLASLVSSLVSQALVLVLLLFPFPATTTTTTHLPSLLPLLLRLLSSSSQLAAASSTAPLLPRKRKRQQTPEPHSGGDESEESGHGQSPVVVGELVPVASPAIHHSPDHFRLSFRMTSSTFEWLSGLLEPLLDCRDPPAGGSSSLRLPAPTRLAIGLSHLATGSPYPDLARRFGVPEAAARFCVRRLCRVLCTNFRFWLAFPSLSDLSSVSAGFDSSGSRLPDCCGAVACTRFEIRGGDTVVAQVVADASSRIVNIATGFRGEKAGSRVLRCSSLYKDVEAGRLLSSSQYLIADHGYPLLPWLMVPFADPAPVSCEAAFNAMHGLMLRPALRTISSLRNWGVLSCPMEEEEEVKMAVACIGTCSILHNALLMREDYSALSDEIIDSFGDDKSSRYYPEEVSLEEHPIEKKAFVIRNKLAERAREIHSSGKSRIDES